MYSSNASFGKTGRLHLPQVDSEASLNVYLIFTIHF